MQSPNHGTTREFPNHIAFQCVCVCVCVRVAGGNQKALSEWDTADCFSHFLQIFIILDLSFVPKDNKQYSLNLIYNSIKVGIMWTMNTA